ncbi:MAG: hypothetical protein COC01_05630 [Bacteroidetes bacterium]|nr:SiaB family protein kinase [Bacteroidia bacterium]PCH67539.1 MAG: hypothetical protein COC01_05630 [Bacteroidota bacterium]
MEDKESLDLYHYYRSMQENNIILSFKGNITADLLTSILEITENKLEKIQEQPRIRRKVFNILVECLQNVYHHMDEMEEEEDDNLVNSKSSVIFMLGQDDESFFITTGNHILNDKVSILTEKIEKINKLTDEELKSFYKEVLTKSEGLSAKGGAGLGLIDMARKSGEKLVYEFQDVDEKYAFFSMYIKVSR